MFKSSVITGFSSWFSYRFYYTNMKYENTLQYSNSIAGMFNWNYTTYIRTHTWLTPELVQKWCNQISNRRCIDAVWSSIERDNANMNHLHLAIAAPAPAPALKNKIVNAINISKSHIGDVQPIRAKYQTIQYINKQLIRENREVNSYHGLFINPKH